MNFTTLAEWTAKKSRFVLLLLFLLAFLTRVLYYEEIRETPITSWHHFPDCDMNFFDAWGKNLASGHWWTNEALHPYHTLHALIAQSAYPEKALTPEEGKAIWEKWLGGKRFHQEPFYPYLVGLLYKMSGNDIEWVFLFQLLLGSVNSILVFLLARRYFGTATAFFAFALALVYGPFKLYESVLLRTTLLTFWGLLTVYVAERAFSSKQKRSFALLGLILGLSFLTKSTILVFIWLFVPMSFFCFPKRFREWFLAMSFLLLGFLLPLLPLVVRNLAVGVAPLEISSVGAYTFINLNASDFRVEGSGLASQYAGTIMRETEGKFLPAVLKTIATYTNILDYGKLLGKKFLLFWDGFEIPNNLNYNYCSQYSYFLSYFHIRFFPINVLFLLGLLLSFRYGRKFWILYLFLLHSLVFQVAFHNLSRFRIPMVALMIPFAAYTLSFLLNSFRQKRYRGAGILLGGILGLSVLFYSVSWQKTSEIGAGDYLVGNHYGMVRMKDKIEQGDREGATEIAEKCLRTEPAFLRQTLEGVSFDASEERLVASFAKLHFWAFVLYKEMGNEAKSQYHQKRYLALSKGKKE